MGLTAPPQQAKLAEPPLLARERASYGQVYRYIIDFSSHFFLPSSISTLFWAHACPRHGWSPSFFTAHPRDVRFSRMCVLPAILAGFTRTPGQFSIYSSLVPVTPWRDGRPSSFGFLIEPCFFCWFTYSFAQGSFCSGQFFASAQAGYRARPLPRFS